MPKYQILISKSEINTNIVTVHSVFLTGLLDKKTDFKEYGSTPIKLVIFFTTKALR